MQSFQATLPRATRDTLLVLAAVALVLLPHVAYLPLWASLMALGMLAWQLWMARKGQCLPSKRLLTTLLVLSVATTLLQFRSIVGPQASVVLLVLLLVLKTLEMRARRDAMVIFFLGFFTLITLFIHSQSFSMAVAMLIAVWGLLAALVNAHMPAGYPSLRQLLCISGGLMLLGTPVMVAMFLSFPRLAPLWSWPPPSAQASTGLSNQMTVGQVASLANNRNVALRVRFDTADGQPPPQRMLYFRGPLLSRFDGRHWQASSEDEPVALPAQTPLPAQALGSTVDYEITLEPHQQRWLLSLDATLTPPSARLPDIAPTADLQWITSQPITQMLRYRAQAHLHYVYGQQLTSRERRTYVQLPRDLNPRTTAWAQSLRKLHGHDDTAIIQAALSRLSDGGYLYTLQPGAVNSMDTADDFWFDRQKGFCEHIASAFVVLMRAAGIPARIVAGYQGGERNALDGLWTVRQSDAHVWTEVWLPHEGWIRVDPTAAVAPARIEQAPRTAITENMWDMQVREAMGHKLHAQITASWEAINHLWNSWVLNFSQQEQDHMARHLGLTRWDAAKAAAFLSVMVVCILASIRMQGWRRMHPPDAWLRLMQSARKQLARQGIAHTESLGLQALARAAQAQWGDESQPLQKWLQQMEQWRYAPHGPHTPSLATLRRHYRALNWPRPRTP